jgi:5-methylcytosine-specific restriction endonuclease McrA
MNTEFHGEFEKAARAEQKATLVVLHFINDCERRKSFLDLGYSSIWDYCTRKLEYSSSTAGRYIKAARCVHQNPEVLEMLEKRQVSVTSINQFASILNDDNKQSLLQQVKGASWREVERIACDYRPPVALSDRTVPVRVATPEGIQHMVFSQFLAAEEYAEVFDDVRNLMPGDMSYGEVLLTVLREYRDRHSPIARQQRREKKGSASLHSHQWESTVENGPTDLHSHQWEWKDAEPSRHIPDEVRDVVFIRDGGQCTFVALDGTRCRCRGGLHIDHITPFANGGRIDMSNLRLLCGAHNRRAAELSMGMHVMQPYWRNQ